MYDFHYNFVKKNFDAKLLFTDAGSLTYEIQKMFRNNFLMIKICLILAIIQKIQIFLMLDSKLLAK